MDLDQYEDKPSPPSRDAARVSPADQAARDRDRVGILQQELASTQAKTSTDPDQIKRNASDVAALQRELAKAQGTKVPAAAPVAQVAAPSGALDLSQYEDTSTPGKKRVDPMAGLPSAAANLTAGVEGAAKGVTGGLFDYLPAAGAYVAGNLQGKNIPFNEALAATRERSADVQAAHPTAYGVGNVAGSIYTGARTAGNSLASLAGSQAALGATQAYTASPDASAADAAKAALAAGVTSGAIGVVGKTVKYATDFLGHDTSSGLINSLKDAANKAVNSSVGQTSLGTIALTAKDLYDGKAPDIFANAVKAAAASAALKTANAAGASNAVAGGVSGAVNNQVVGQVNPMLQGNGVDGAQPAPYQKPLGIIPPPTGFHTLADVSNDFAARMAAKRNPIVAAPTSDYVEPLGNAL